MDSHLEGAYESAQAADIDDLDGFEFSFDDETEDDEEPDGPLIDDEPVPVWPSDEEKREAELYEPAP